ncbi:amphi-Trp domain-containing protein [Thalassorhabdus alkalitolerans]|uniref:Amphi-Trp domain-containing protein n=1 Tax=Thalassorhabdus alkalitolerans TaxID=2282697 RepID=A0ABW0YIT4_9BACI|nr:MULTISPECIES: amphi-Trp domain-containing protein [Bacillaceae]
MFGQERLEKQLLFKHKEKQSLEEAARFFENVAAKLRENGECSFIQDDEEVSLRPAKNVTYEIEYTQKGKKHSFEFELEWIEGDDSEDPKLRIR